MLQRAGIPHNVLNAKYHEREAEIVAQAGRIYEQAQDALARGDFETYGRLIEQLGELLQGAGL